MPRPSSAPEEVVETAETTKPRQMMRRAVVPVAVVEAVDPIVLDARIMDCCGKRDCDCDLCEVPSFVNSCFDGELSSGDDSRRVYVTLGQFSIVRLERDTQLLVPVYDYGMPEKECRNSIAMPVAS